jgi:hypothetical protein
VTQRSQSAPSDDQRLEQPGSREGPSEGGGELDLASQIKLIVGARPRRRAPPVDNLIDRDGRASTCSMPSSTRMRRRRDASSGSGGSSATEQVKVAKQDVDNARSSAERTLADGRCIAATPPRDADDTVTTAGTGSCRGVRQRSAGTGRGCPDEVLPTSAGDRERARGTARHQRSGEVASGARRVDDRIVGHLGRSGGVEHRLARLLGRDRCRTRAM